VLKEKTGIKESSPELRPAGISDQADALAGSGSAEEAAGVDPTGLSAGTMVGNMNPLVQ
jgi:hypothetical protein